MQGKHIVTAKRLMARLYVNIGGLAKYMGTCFFYSMEEYYEQARIHNWNNDCRARTSWCTEPVPVDVVTGVRYLRTLSS